MRGTIVVESQAEFNAWLASKPKTAISFGNVARVCKLHQLQHLQLIQQPPPASST